MTLAKGGKSMAVVTGPNGVEEHDHGVGEQLL
jgi:hypothetical protein